MGRKTKRRKRTLPGFLLKLLLLLLVLGALWYLPIKMLYQKVSYQEAEYFTGQPYQEDGVINILLIGNDERADVQGSRSDAMILLSISSRTKTVQMISLLRDMYVEIPGYGGNRLNAAYSYGGAELLLKTVEQNFEIPVHRYVTVDFEAFVQLVDAVGGVDLELSKGEKKYVNGYLVEYNMLTGRQEGTDNLDTSTDSIVHLNGPQALAYTRIRYIGTDFGRTERQRKVLSAGIKSLPKAILKSPEKLLDGVLANLTTNLTVGECYALSFQAGKLALYEIQQGSVPIEGSYRDAVIRGMAVLEVDMPKNRSYLQEAIYGGKD